MRYIFLIMLVFLSSCSKTVVDHNDDDEFGGQSIKFIFDENNITAGHTLKISTDYNNTVYLYEYCGVPFAILERVKNHWRYIYPDSFECSEPQNISMHKNMTFSLEDLKFRQKEELAPNLYMLKIYYSTYGPAKYVREHKEIIEIS